MTKQGKLLIVDDDPLVLEALYEMFVDEYDIITASSGSDAVAFVKSECDINTIVLDIKMEKMDGLETAAEINKIDSSIPIIFNTGYPGEYSEDKIKNELNPFDYIGKNERPTRLIESVRKAVFSHKLNSSKEELIELARKEYKMVGNTQVMLNIYQRIEQVSKGNSKVMILGPTGTGKELVAQAIHNRSLRAKNVFKVFSCHDKSSDLVKSELFGHVKGAYTGATEDRVGTFEYADKGTVFLDEIGDLDFSTQAKILRVLELGEMSRVGSSKIINVDVRLICATHHNLVQMVDEKKFRDDLYYRLKGIIIELPELRSRAEDIPLLIDYFSELHTQANNLNRKLFDQEARNLLIDFDWPGNVRQLQDTVQSLIDMTPSDYISKENVEKYLKYKVEVSNSNLSLKEQTREFKKRLIIKKLDKFDGNMSAAARELSVDAANLRKLIIELNISY
ncbi:MAG: sigma-54-dependent Fis family transcriptional regulator [Calditrichaeota bacterium]|nr:MAG: sigma-54-dependent Fis family transcriptional regulator [Calditrichota bacterium]